LAPLALDPEIAVLFLEQLELLLALDVDLFHLALAVVADDVLIGTEQVLAAQTRLLHLGELEEAHVRAGHRRLKDVAHVVPCKQLHLSPVAIHRLEESEQRLLQLFLEVVLVVDREVVL